MEKNTKIGGGSSDTGVEPVICVICPGKSIHPLIKNICAKALGGKGCTVKGCTAKGHDEGTVIFENGIPFKICVIEGSIIKYINFDPSIHSVPSKGGGGGLDTSPEPVYTVSSPNGNLPPKYVKICSKALKDGCNKNVPCTCSGHVKGTMIYKNGEPYKICVIQGDNIKYILFDSVVPSKEEDTAKAAETDPEIEAIILRASQVLGSSIGGISSTEKPFVFFKVLLYSLINEPEKKSELQIKVSINRVLDHIERELKSIEYLFQAKGIQVGPITEMLSASCVYMEGFTLKDSTENTWLKCNFEQMLTYFNKPV